MEKLQDDLEILYKWEKSNNMKLMHGNFNSLDMGLIIEVNQDTLYCTVEMEDIIERIRSKRFRSNFQ